AEERCGGRRAERRPPRLHRPAGARRMTKRMQCQRCGKDVSADAEGVLHLARCRAYNGWTNFETWAVALWIDNAQASYHYWREMEDECRREEEEGTRTAAGLLADRIKDEYEDAACERLGNRADVFADLLSAALSDVDWYEIAEHLLTP